MISATEENYLKAIFKIAEKEKKTAGTNAISKHMKTSAASVTDMIKRLSEKNLVNYAKYRGVSLTSEGNRIATNLIRKHRLWEVFLVDKLNFQWEQVHDMAEELEHINSDELVNRLDDFLGNPKFDPHGDPIPSTDGKFTLRSQIPLSNMKINSVGTLIGVKHHDQDFLEYLNSLSVKLGTSLKVVEKNNYDHAMRVLIDSEREAVLSEKVTQNLWMKKDLI